MTLNNEDVQEILRLLDTLPFDELHLEMPRFTLTLRRVGAAAWTQETLVRPPSDVEPAASAHDLPSGAPGANGHSTTATTETREGLVAVRAPLLGTFYRAPRPGAPPFVEVGSSVDEQTIVGILETMKLMNSVPAGARGTVVEICLENAMFAEQDAVLMLIEPQDR
jgi:acetyl-CoA carboxylase biotin carboxyl carrier protein